MTSVRDLCDPAYHPMSTRERNAIYKPGKFERKAIRMRKALQAMRRCPGIDHTDQETGETFRFLVDEALKRNFPGDEE